MTDSRIQPGMFVEYTHLGIHGIGKVREGGNIPLVEFWNGKEERKDDSGLTPLPDADAELVAWLWDSPQNLEPWAKEKPLKLVALALFIDGGKGDPNSIKEKLDGRVLWGADWKNWWRQRAKSLNAFSALPEPEHFAKSSKGNEYRLLCDIEAVPDDLRPPVSLDDWKKWLSSEANLPTFGKNPSKVLCESLSEWPADTIERTLKRILWGAELLLASPKKPSATAALSWMDAVGSVTLRWNKLNPEGHELAKQSSGILTMLALCLEVKEKRRESTLFQVGQLSEAPDRERLLRQQWQEQENQRAEYESLLKQQWQEQESQRAEYESLLKQQWQEQESQRTNYEAELEILRQSHVGAVADLQGVVRLRNQELERQREKRRELEAQLQRVAEN